MPSEEKSDDIKDSFYEEIEQAFNIFLSKVNLIPQHAEVAQGVPVSLRFRIFLTFGTTWSSALRTGSLYPGRNPCYSFSETESTPGHMVPSGATEKIDPGTSRLVAQCLNHYATPGPLS